MKNIRQNALRVISFFPLMLLLVACATAPQRNEELDRAHLEVQKLSEDPDARTAASEQLGRAENDLHEADRALADHRPPVEVTHLAYLARREAQVGLAHIEELRAREQLKTATAERERMLLEAQAREARNARSLARSEEQASAAHEEAKQARDQAREAQQHAQEAQQQLAELHAQQTPRGLQLTLASDLLFDTGAATVKPGAELTLSRLSDFMKQNPRTQIIIEGNTDGRGSEEFNQVLSERRARAVAQVLEARGVTEDRIRALGRGKDFPVASNASPEGRQQNRRVDIVLSDASGHFAQQADQAPIRR
jgi:outer membrane protein OmpA-like peptidoglycan-associated protein